VSEVQVEGKVNVQQSQVGFGLECECQWKGVQHNWLIVQRLKLLGLCEWGYADIYCVLCVRISHCQNNAAPLLISCTVNLCPYLHITRYSNVFFIAKNNMVQQHDVGGGRIETYTSDLRCETFSVENCNVKNMRKYLVNNI